MNGLTKTSPCVIMAQKDLTLMFTELDNERSDIVSVRFNESDDTWTVEYSTGFTLPVWSGNDDIDSGDSMEFTNKYTWNEAQSKLMLFNRYNMIAMEDAEEFIDNCINIGWYQNILNHLTQRSVLAIYDALEDYALVRYREDNVDPAYVDLCVAISKCRK